MIQLMTQLFFGLMEVQDAPQCSLSHKKTDHSSKVILIQLALKTHMDGKRTSPWSILNIQLVLASLPLQKVWFGMILVLLKINLLDLHCSSKNSQILLVTSFIFLEKAMEEFMFHMVLGNFTKTIYNLMSLTDVMLLTHGLMPVLMVMPLPTLEPTITSKV